MLGSCLYRDSRPKVSLSYSIKTFSAELLNGLKFFCFANLSCTNKTIDIFQLEQNSSYTIMSSRSLNIMNPLPSRIFETWYNLYNLKNVKNTHGGVILSEKFQAEVTIVIYFESRYLLVR